MLLHMNLAGTPLLVLAHGLSAPRSPERTSACVFQELGLNLFQCCFRRCCGRTLIRRLPSRLIRSFLLPAVSDLRTLVEKPPGRGAVVAAAKRLRQTIGSFAGNDTLRQTADVLLAHARRDTVTVTSATLTCSRAYRSTYRCPLRCLSGQTRTFVVGALRLSRVTLPPTERDFDCVGTQAAATTASVVDFSAVQSINTAQT